jgi:hypothetical protein
MSSDTPLYTQGVCHDGAAILKDGVMMTVDEIVAELSRYAALRAENEAYIHELLRELAAAQAEIQRLNDLIAWRDAHAPDLPACVKKLKAAMEHAELYRFIRDQKESLFYLFPKEEIGSFGACVDLAAFPQGEELDAAIKAAMSKENMK